MKKMNDIYLVTGNGQDSSYLCESLLRQDKKVVCVSRRSARVSNNLTNDVLNNPNFNNITCVITDISGMMSIIDEYKPKEFYNLAAVTHVHQSFIEPITTMRVNGEAVVGILEGIRLNSPDTRLYQASTSELFGANGIKTGRIINGRKEIVLVQDETTAFNPRSPYAAAKLYSHEMVRLYREAYNLYVCSGILFNHTSPRRPKDFIVRKITDGVAQVKLGLNDKVRLGNIKAYRDIGFAGDYVEMMQLMLRQDTPDDFVISTNETVSIEDMLRYACELADLDFDDVYEHDPAFMRPLEVPYLCGDCTKAKEKLGWEPSHNWRDLIKMMYENDLRLLSV